jgi:polyisoprenyl-phosphate glycosyltransferase
MKKLISIMVPVYNEEAVLTIFYNVLCKTVNKITNYNFEIIFVNDGSKDQTLSILRKLKLEDHRISYLSLSRNFGKEIAMAAGFDYTNGDAVIIIDSDLQDPPELIFEMISKWEDGYDDVYAKRISREGETWLKKFTSRNFYRLLSRISKVDIQRNTGDFRLLSRKAVESIKKFKESERYTKGLFSLIGHKKIAIDFNRNPRAAGKTKWNYRKLFNLAIEGLTSFSTAPLKIFTYLGFIIAIIAFIYTFIIVFKTIVYGEPVRGYPSLVSIVLFIGGIQLISLGIIGEYLGRVFNETKNRPLYLVDEFVSSEI